MVGAFLGGYIILYGQVQSWTPQLVTGPLNQTPPNKMTEVFWGFFNVYPTLIAAIVFYARSVRLLCLVGLCVSLTSRASFQRLETVILSSATTCRA